jgi:hypothetical protein
MIFAYEKTFSDRGSRFVVSDNMNEFFQNYFLPISLGFLILLWMSDYVFSFSKKKRKTSKFEKKITKSKGFKIFQGLIITLIAIFALYILSGLVNHIFNLK